MPDRTLNPDASLPLRYAMYFPSGDHEGHDENPGGSVSWSIFSSSSRLVKMPQPESLSQSKAICSPSGEKVAAPSKPGRVVTGTNSRGILEGLCLRMLYRPAITQMRTMEKAAAPRVQSLLRTAGGLRLNSSRSSRISEASR